MLQTVFLSEAKQHADIAQKYKIDLGYTSAEVQKTIDQCNAVGSLSIPANDQRSQKEKNSFSKTDCLYFRASQNWSNYRKCVLSDENPDNNQLAEIYANGWGVQRNPSLAIALICHGKGEPSEIIGMVNSLYASRFSDWYDSKNQEHLQAVFDFCDYANTNDSIWCDMTRNQLIGQYAEDYKRNNKFTTIIQNWTGPQKIAFNILKERADDFISEHANSEQDTSGTSSLQVIIGEKEQRKDEFLRELQTFEAGQLPKQTDFSEADKSLNVLYIKVLQHVKTINPDTGETIVGIRSTERKWIKYRDAWVTFATLRYPHTTPALWKTWVTQQRIAQLKTVLNDTSGYNLSDT